MTGSKNGPFANEDAVVAVGLAFAGMAILQGKLFPSFTVVNQSFAGLWNWKVFEWWPLLLIAAGIWIWLRERRRKRLTLNSRSGGGK